MFLRTLVRRFVAAVALLLPAAAAANPSAYVSFSPGTARQGDSVLLAISLLDLTGGQITNAQLASGVFQFPAGMTASATNPAPTINCPGGTASAVPGSTTMSFTAPLIAPSSSCGVTIYVDFAAPGTYTAALPPGAITSDQGPATNAQAGTITITPAPIVTNTNDAGPGSLRDAINIANASCGGFQVISFNIPGTGPFVITPVTALPAIICPSVAVDGYTQPLTIRRDGMCTPPGLLVELSGAACGGTCNGLEFSTYGGLVQGLAIHSWGNAGLSIAGTTNVYGNIIGADSTANAPRGNAFAGIQVVGSSASIGSGNVADDNLIVANGKGIYANNGSVAVNGNQIGGLGNCAAGNGNGVGIFLDTNAMTSSVNNAYIHFSTGPGIAVAPDATSRFLFRTNSIADNGGIGIDLNNDGPSPNDEASVPYDQDGGANGTQNYPDITGIVYDAPSNTTTVTGVLNSGANGSGTVEIYQNLSVRPGITEGNSFLGSVFITTDASGKGTFTVSVPGNVDNLSAASQFQPCIDCAGYSSEFSPTITKASVVPPVGPQLSYSPARPQVAAFVGGPGTTFVLTATNTGDQDVTFSGSPPFVGSPASYAFVSSTCTTIKPLESCSITMMFSPTAAGAQPGTVTVTSNDPKSPQAIAINGVGFDPPTIAITIPASLPAGGTTTISLRVTNANPAPIDQVSAMVTFPGGFTVIGTPVASCVASSTGIGYAVPANANCTVYDVPLQVPASPGTYTFAVAVNAFHVGIPAVYDNPVAILATVTVVPSTVTVSPSSLAFGTIGTGTPSAPQNITLTTASRLPVPVTSVTGPAGYLIDPSNCASGVGSSGCVIAVTFAPTVPGTYNGTFVITAGGVNYSVGVTGAAVVPLPPLAASVTPSSLTFAPRSLGTTSGAQPVTVTNAGASALSISNIAIQGDFGFSSTCPVTTTLAPGASCTVNVTFTPLVVGTRTGSLTLTTNDPGSPHVVALSGQGVIVPVATLGADPAALDFAARTLGSTSPSQVVTLTNSGNADAAISIATSGPFALAPVPAGSAGCGATLGAGASCAIAVTFTPIVVGGVSGAVVVDSNASNPRFAVALSGVGIAAPPPRALSLPGTIDFGSQPFGLRSAARALVISNTSGQAVTVSDIRLAGDFSADDGCAIVPARGSCSVNLYFTPTGRGGRTGSATITVAGDTRPYIVALLGDGGANPVPLLSVSPLRIGFGNALVGPSGPGATVTLRNVGELPVELGTVLSPGDFLVANHCPGTLLPGASCVIDLAFYPRLTGLRAQALQIPSNAAGAPHKVELTGTGCALPSAARARTGQLVCSS